jgi:hypothetical protein
MSGIAVTPEMKSFTTQFDVDPGGGAQELKE